ncbi:MAG: hypothetical protein KJ558_14410 [Gammaproteobacteria bacterium]|nr:hypothetical protein [Gammaproteobacteria bacterium]MBU1655982.1 hypothetical protein [Gammaproteobacteria bacterium]MBU1962566.1 hypothetical protein [Gammaproteobacteria bacterium]
MKSFLMALSGPVLPLILSLPLIAPLGHAAGDELVPARFRVTTAVVNPDLQPFTATINGMGNSLVYKGAGFEPVIYRTKLMAREDSPDRILAEPSAISNWDSLREGALDGADVRVYRIEKGRFRLVRQDRVAKGGHRASGWLPLNNGNALVPSGTTRFSFRWDSWNRRDADYYFSVQAIDVSGNASPFAAPFSIKRPNEVGQGQATNSETPFQPARLSLDKTPPPAPANLRGRRGIHGELILEWDPVAARDLAGYRVFRSDYPSQAHQGYALQLAGSGESIKAGDLVILGKKFYAGSRNRYLSNRIWGAETENNIFKQDLVDFFPDENPRRSWELLLHRKDTPVEEPGETCLKLDLAPGEKAEIGIWNHSGTGQDWYEVLEKRPYRMEVWLRQEGNGRVRFDTPGFYGPVEGVPPVDFQVGKGWRKYEASFTPKVIDKGGNPSRMRLEFRGPGSFYVDNFRIYPADATFLDLTPRDYERLREAGIGALRTHGLIKTGVRSYDLAQLTNPGGVITGSDKLNTLPQSLAIIRKSGVRPWLQIEPHLSPEEWLGLMEYLAAPFDPAKDDPAAKPWAYKRYRQGQQRPWLDEFDRVYFELGNETWNGLFRPWTFEDMTDAATGEHYSGGRVYGLFQEHVISILRSSPYWQPAGLDRKVDFILGGWADQEYGKDAASASPSSRFLTIGAYIGGWDEAEGPPDLSDRSFFSVLNQVSQSAIPNAERHAAEVRGIGREGLGVGTYEAGPGYALSGLNNATVSEKQAEEQEQVMKSLAAGTATLDTFLARARLGFRLQNFFTFGEGSYWRSHAKWYRGGQAYPSWKLLGLFNTQATGDLLRVETLSVPTTDLAGFDRRKAVTGAPLVAAYATRRGDRFNLFLLSRRLPNYPVKGDAGYSPLTLELPFASARSLTLYRMQGDPRANNTQADRVGIEKLELPPPTSLGEFKLGKATGADERGLPPAATYLYVFELR